MTLYHRSPTRSAALGTATVDEEGFLVEPSRRTVGAFMSQLRGVVHKEEGCHCISHDLVKN